MAQTDEEDQRSRICDVYSRRVQTSFRSGRNQTLLSHLRMMALAAAVASEVGRLIYRYLAATVIPSGRTPRNTPTLKPNRTIEIIICSKHTINVYYLNSFRPYTIPTEFSQAALRSHDLPLMCLLAMSDVDFILSLNHDLQAHFFRNLP